MPDLNINDQLIIPEQELTITASRSSGPGGQHVNKADTASRCAGTCRIPPC
jgi:ribosome-associated protein